MMELRERISYSYSKHDFFSFLIYTEFKQMWRTCMNIYLYKNLTWVDIKTYLTIKLLEKKTYLTTYPDVN